MKPNDSEPPLPRRLFVAACLAAGLAASGSFLAWQGRVGAPDMATFQFSRGDRFATGEADRLRAYLLPALQDDRYAVIIIGHSGTAGDGSANMALSESRAQAAAALAERLGVDPSRLTVTGVGGASPLPRDPDESERAWQSRLARVDVALQVRR